MFIVFLIAALLIFAMAGVGYARDWFQPLGWGLFVLTLGYLLMSLGLIAAGR